jgi:hypothetical protein
MLKAASAVFAATMMLLPALAAAQGTQNPNSNNRPNGVGTNAQSDPMGGAFRGTGTPTFGTSPGMGSDNRQQRRN